MFFHSLDLIVCIVKRHNTMSHPIRDKIRLSPIRLQSETAVVDNIRIGRQKVYTAVMCLGMELLLSTTKTTSVDGKSETTIDVLIQDRTATRKTNVIIPNVIIPFHYSLELYPLPYDNNNKQPPLRNDDNYFCETTETPVVIEFVRSLHYAGNHQQLLNDLRDEYLSDPANGFADENGHYQLFVRFTVSLDGPVEAESNYEIK